MDGWTQHKCAPPIRDSRNNKRLWKDVGKGAIDMVVSDHSPSPPAMKRVDTGNFFEAWGGISSLQIGLPVMWTSLSGRNYSLKHLVRWMCSGPARLVGLEKHKGTIGAGYDADLVIWNPETRFILRPQMLHNRHQLTPYSHHPLRGEVETTFLRGEMIYDRGQFLGKPKGTLLRRVER